MAEAGAPIAWTIPTETVMFGGNIAVLDKIPRPNAARLFCDFACSAEGQTIINDVGATIPTHPNATATEARLLARLSALHTLTRPDYNRIIADMPMLLAEWEKYVGR